MFYPRPTMLTFAVRMQWQWWIKLLMTNINLGRAPKSPGSPILQPHILAGGEKKDTNFSLKRNFRVPLMKDRKEVVVVVLNFDLRVQNLLIFSVTKWVVCLQHLWYKLKDNGRFKEKPSGDYLNWSWTIWLFCGTPFLLERMTNHNTMIL